MLVMRVFVPDRPIQPSLMFVGKARAYLNEVPFSSSDSRIGSWPYPLTMDNAGKARQGQTL